MQIPTLVDNIEGNTLQKLLESLLAKSVTLDIATGTFEIGALQTRDIARAKDYWLQYRETRP